MKKIKFKKSSLIKKVYYNNKTKTLNVTFYNDQIYTYSNVSSQRILAWKNSNSVGSYFCKNISRNYKYRKLS